MKKENSLHNWIVSACLVGLLFLLAINVRAAHGDPDLSFGSHGVKTDHVSNKDMYPTAIAQQADGKLLVAGRMTGTGYPFDLLLLRRYNTNGSVDTGFGLSGFGVEILNGQPWYIYGEANSLTVQTDGKIVLAGGYYSLGSTEIKPAVFRFLSSGDLDTSFGDEGRVTFDEDDAGWPSGITFFKGRLLAIVTSSSGSRKLVRLKSDGDLDTGFGVTGMADIGINSRTFTVNRVGGKIIVGGSLPDPDLIGGIPALQHFNMNGTPDTSHGIEGIVLLTLSPWGPDFAANSITSLDTQADGKIIAGNAYGSPGVGPVQFGRASDVRRHFGPELRHRRIRRAGRAGRRCPPREGLKNVHPDHGFRNRIHSQPETLQQRRRSPSRFRGVISDRFSDPGER